MSSGQDRWDVDWGEDDWIDNIQEVSQRIYDQKPIFDTLCLSGGGIKGINQLGVLYYFWKDDMLKNISIYIGTSIGSIISYLLILGYSPLDILDYIRQVDITGDFRSLDIANFSIDHALCRPITLRKCLTELTQKKYQKIPTLKELYDTTNKKLVCVTYNFTEKKPEYLSPESNPDLSCIDALTMSCSIPLVYPCFSYRGCEYIDGGVCDIFPVKYFDDGTHKILGIYTPGFFQGKGVFSYFCQVISIPIYELVQKTQNSISDNVEIIEIPGGSKGYLNFELTDHETIKMFREGYNYIKNKSDKNLGVH